MTQLPDRTSVNLSTESEDVREELEELLEGSDHESTSELIRELIAEAAEDSS